MNDEDAKKKANLIAYMVQHGATEAEANEIYDLAMHAAEEALARISTVVMAGSSLLVAASAHSCALRFLEVNIGESLKQKAARHGQR